MMKALLCVHCSPGDVSTYQISEAVGQPPRGPALSLPLYITDRWPASLSLNFSDNTEDSFPVLESLNFSESFV